MPYSAAEKYPGYVSLQGAAKKWTPKVFRCFLSNGSEFQFEILRVYLANYSTSNCQAKFDSVKK